MNLDKAHIVHKTENVYMHPATVIFPRNEIANACAFNGFINLACLFVERFILCTFFIINLKKEQTLCKKEEVISISPGNILSLFFFIYHFYLFFIAIVILLSNRAKFLSSGTNFLIACGMYIALSINAVSLQENKYHQ